MTPESTFPSVSVNGTPLSCAVLTLTVVHGGPASERPKTGEDGSTEEEDNFLLGDQGRFPRRGNAWVWSLKNRRGTVGR